MNRLFLFADYQQLILKNIKLFFAPLTIIMHSFVLKTKHTRYEKKNFCNANRHDIDYVYSNLWELFKQ